MIRLLTTNVYGLRMLSRSMVRGFSSNTWKDREESAEKVYISQQESMIVVGCRKNASEPVAQN